MARGKDGCVEHGSLLRRRMWSVSSLLQTIELPQHEIEHPVLVRIIRKCRHLLLDSLRHLHQLAPDLFQGHRGVIG